MDIIDDGEELIILPYSIERQDHGWSDTARDNEHMDRWRREAEKR